VKSLRDFDHLFEVNILNINFEKIVGRCQETAVIYDFIFDNWYKFQLCMSCAKRFKQRLKRLMEKKVLPLV